MGRITASLNITPDGFCNHDAVVADAEFTRFATAQVEAAERLLLGRKTYELFESYWPEAARNPAHDPLEYALGKAIVAIPRTVVSRTLTFSDWEGTEFVSDITDFVADGEVLLLGSPSIHSRLASDGRIERFCYLVHPMLPARGARLFEGSRSHPSAIRFIKSQSFASGVRVLEYARD
ncbi:dihydrofolate reductase family protein [Croceicoccus bisphenolivorans]|uniref:dihydrofolate reductase family protein n=1 Tax=Croceicoccus bisphenolivorans TaxID=1783232 RepID=UPI0008320D0A|nr:hypothetical protein [Croceicoccus bisphenolivorans]